MSSITGHVRIEDRKSGRVWVAKYGLAAGGETRKVLGPAWAKDSGRKTARGAPVWRVADGAKPEGHLTPKEAQGELAKLLDSERRKPSAPATTIRGKTFGDAAVAWLQYLEHEKRRAPSTMARYRSIVKVHLLPEFGEQAPLRRVTTEAIDDYRKRLLTEDALSLDAIRQNLSALNGILARAVRSGWIGLNPADRAERLETPKASGDFNVLTPAQVESVARAAEADWERLEPGDRKHTRISEARAASWTQQRRSGAHQYACIIRFAAYSGLRMGELRALRWRDIDWSNSVIHVRWNAPTSGPANQKRKTPKSGLVRSVPMSDQAGAAVEALSRRGHCVGPEDLVFLSPTGGKVDGPKVRGAFYRALDTTGLGHLRQKENPITAHDLRHTFGTLAVRAPGTSIKDVQAWMGHADIKTTMRYLHYVPRHDAGRRLSEAFAIEATALVAEEITADP